MVMEGWTRDFLSEEARSLEFREEEGLDDVVEVGRLGCGCEGGGWEEQ
jgi:hypothetical protein